MARQRADGTAAQSMPDLSGLADLPSEVAEHIVPTQSRSTAPNPMDGHLKLTYDEGFCQEQGQPKPEIKYYNRQVKNATGNTQTERAWYGQARHIKVSAEIAHYVERLLRTAGDRQGVGVTVDFFDGANKDAKKIDRRELPGSARFSLIQKDGKTLSLSEGQIAKRLESGEITQEDVDGATKVRKIQKNRDVWVSFAAKKLIERNKGDAEASNESGDESGDEDNGTEGDENDSQEGTQAMSA